MTWGRPTCYTTHFPKINLSLGQKEKKEKTKREKKKNGNNALHNLIMALPPVRPSDFRLVFSKAVFPDTYSRKNHTVLFYEF